MKIYVDTLPGGEAMNIGLAHALARRADGTPGYEAAHIYQPSGRSLVFSRRDTRLPGFPDAVRAARDAGFDPVIRAVGGRAVAYTEEAVVVHHVRNEKEPTRGHDARFVEFGHLLLDALGGLGVRVQLGAVPGEYCPGAQSINARGKTKVAGTAQRILRRAWLFASLIVVGDEGVIRPVLTQVYGHLGQDFDPNSVGSLSSENPAIDTRGVAESLLGVFAGVNTATSITGAGDLLMSAADLVADTRTPA